MAAHIGQPARTQRFIKVYLCIWGLLAVGALAYLTLLAFPPQALFPPQAAVKPSESESKALAEVRGSIGEIRKDVSELKTAVGERVENEKVVKTRLTALEERVSVISSTSDSAKGKLVKDGESPASDPSGKSETDTAKPDDKTAGAGQIETGSLPPKAEVKEEIVFGEPIVTRNGREFAVQLAAAASLNVLRQSWGQIAERHAAALGGLQPRVVAPRADGGLYRLIVGPLPTKADAERVCSELRVGPKACFPTPYTGAPL